MQQSCCGVIEYAVGDTGQTLVLTDTVLGHLRRYRQSSRLSREAGGQLFARIDGDTIIIERATGPRRSDKRTPLSFIPSRIAERREIRSFFKQGLHYVGDWHTHPEAHPRPSATDERSMTEMFRKSHHQLAGFILVIVGTAEDSSGLFVGISNGQRLMRLLPR